MKTVLFRMRIVAFVLLVALCVPLFSCATAQTVTFGTLGDKTDRVSLDGERVELFGYLVTNTPTDGGFVYITSRPYERISLSSDKTDVIPVYTKNTSGVASMTKAVRVVGRLEIASSEPFVTEVGYVFTVRIVDATVETASASALPAEGALWQQIAASGFINNMMDAFNYVHFVCAWNTYSGKNDDGTQFYLSPSQAEYFIKTEHEQYYYGYNYGYFDRLRETARSFGDEETAGLASLLTELQALAEEGLASLDGGNYTQGDVEAADILDGFVGYKYSVNNAEELIATYEELYEEFTEWLGVWELP